MSLQYDEYWSITIAKGLEHTWCKPNILRQIEFYYTISYIECCKSIKSVLKIIDFSCCPIFNVDYKT